MKITKSRNYLIIFIILLLQNEEISSMENNTKKNETIQYNLPRLAIPVSYEIKLIPNIVEGNFTFVGESKIVIKIIEETKNITLHSQDLKINENFTNLVNFEGFMQKPKKHFYVNATKFLIIEFQNPILIGNYILSLKYSGNTTNDPEGLYHSSYIDNNGKKVWLATTKFTQIHARRSFPCWDEPDLKATFNLSIKHYSNLTAVSNMPIRTKFLDSDGKEWTNFQVTPVMSTYLLAFVVSDFECLRNEKKTFNVCSRKDVLPNLRHSFDVSRQALTLLEEYMDFKYNLGKIDQFAIPDATMGATENWGLIIYRESSFVYEPFVHPVSTKEYITLTIIHELAHQWIGNLVTQKSWKFSWVKEGLPTFLQYYITDKIFPDWREMDMFVARVIQESAFQFDQSDYYKHLEWEYDNPIDIRKKFSQQIYNKGAAIFHMMSNILSESTFRAGIIKFVKDNAYDSFTSNDLWDAMQFVYNKNNKDYTNIIGIKEIMTPWIEQQGYPIINVTRDYQSRKVVITQEGNMQNLKSNRWWIPINFATKTNPNFDIATPTHWLKPNDERLTIDGIDTEDWIIVNIQQSGYYRVNYDETNWKRIAEYLNSDNYEKIHVRNRAQLINDLSFMASTNRQNYTTFLDLISYLRREEDYVPWLPTLRAVRKLREKMFDEGVNEELKKFILGLMEKVIQNIGFVDNSKYDWLKKYKKQYDEIDCKTKKLVPVEKTIEKFYKIDFLPRRLRAKFISFACSLGHKECKNSAKAQLRANIENATENPISPDLVSWVNCYGAEGFENELLKKVNGSDIKYLGYLGCSPDKTVLRSYVEKAIAGESNATVKQTRTAFGYLSEDGRNNLDSAINYLTQNFDEIYNYFDREMKREKMSPNSISYAISIMNDYLWRCHTLDQLNKISELVNKESKRISSWFKELIVEHTKHIEWSEENAPIFGEWLHDNSSEMPVAA